MVFTNYFNRTIYNLFSSFRQTMFLAKKKRSNFLEKELFIAILKWKNWLNKKGTCNSLEKMFLNLAL